MSRGDRRRSTALIVGASLLGGIAVGVALSLILPRLRAHGAADDVSRGRDVVPFYGKHQAGITTAPQSFVFVAAFDVTTTSRDELRRLLERWTEVAARLTAGRNEHSAEGEPAAPPADTGETFGYAPAKLTMTFGAGPSLFDGRFGLASHRPAALVDIPHFLGDRLRPEISNGDLGVQICADDPQVAFHALRELARAARGVAALRWSQQGFRPTPAANTAGATARNLQGFKDGTVNPGTGDADLMDRWVLAEAGDGSAWMAGGSYLVLRRIRMHIEVWDRSSLQDQENTIGRKKESGAPLGGRKESEELDLSAREAGEPVIPEDAHVRRAHGSGAEHILRRPFAFVNGIDPRTGELDAGLLYITFQRDPRTQFIPIQERLAAVDALNEYIVHVGSAIFACFPGVEKDGYIGESLFR